VLEREALRLLVSLFSEVLLAKDIVIVLQYIVDGACYFSVEDTNEPVLFDLIGMKQSLK